MKSQVPTLLAVMRSDLILHLLVVVVGDAVVVVVVVVVVPPACVQSLPAAFVPQGYFTAAGCV